MERIVLRIASVIGICAVSSSPALPRASKWSCKGDPAAFGQLIISTSSSFVLDYQNRSVIILSSNPNHTYPFEISGQEVRWTQPGITPGAYANVVLDRTANRLATELYVNNQHAMHITASCRSVK
jgi:hypothetical protein